MLLGLLEFLINAKFAMQNAKCALAWIHFSFSFVALPSLPSQRVDNYLAEEVEENQGGPPHREGHTINCMTLACEQHIRIRSAYPAASF